MYKHFNSLCFYTIIAIICVVIPIIVGRINPYKSSLVHHHKRNTGLIFYNLRTHKPFLPPIVTTLNYPQSRLPIIGEPCSCVNFNCGCCAGLNIQQFNFNQKFCTNFTYNPNDFAIKMDVHMNENNIYEYMASAKNPPPLCIPVPIPYVPLNTEICVKIFDIFTPGRNLHMCMDMQAKVQKAPVIVLHFDCMRMGQDGWTFLKPEDGGGIITPITEPDQSEIMASQPANQSPAKPSIEPEPEQTDSDVYDEVSEIKANE